MLHRRKQTQRSGNRSRRPGSGTLNESFRRNNVVISKSQRELAQRQQSVTQRQLDMKKTAARRRVRHQVIGCIILVLLAALAYRMNIGTVALSSNASSRLSGDQQEVYENTLLKAARSNTILGQSWLLDEEALNRELQKRYPEVERVSVSSSAPFSTSLRTEVRFRQPVFIWQDATQTEQFIDKNGILFAKNLDPTVSTKKLTRIEDQSGVVLDPGSSVLTSRLIQFVGQLHSKVPPLYGAGHTITKVIIPKSTREVQIQVTNQPYLIKLSSTRTLDEEVGELRQLLAFLKEKQVTPTAYIDIRIPHKAFYK